MGPLEGSVRYQGVDKASTGFKLLAAMGWREGEGLGAQKQGITSHIRVRKKIDSSGVGADQASAQARDWTITMAGYDNILAAAAEAAEKHAQDVAMENAAKLTGGRAQGDDEQALDPKRAKKKARKSDANSAGELAQGEGGEAPEVKRGKKKKAQTETEEDSNLGRGADRKKGKRKKGRDAEGDDLPQRGNEELGDDDAEPCELSRPRKRSRQTLRKGQSGELEGGQVKKAKKGCDEAKKKGKGGCPRMLASRIEPGSSQPDGASRTAPDESKHAKTGNVGDKAAAGSVAGAEQQTAVGERKATSHLARFQRRRQGKLVHAYSGNDLAAILGVSAAIAAQPAGGTEATKEGMPANGLVGKLAHLSEEVPIEDEAEDDAGAPGQATNGKTAWWRSQFVRKGRLGSMRQDTCPSEGEKDGEGIRVHGFREADQEGLYKLAHDNAGHGRKGLGGSQALKKVAGARWAGTRTVLASDSEGEEEEGDTDQEACMQNEVDNEGEADQIVILGARRGLNPRPGVAPSGGSAAEPSTSPPKPDAAAAICDSLQAPPAVGKGKEQSGSVTRATLDKRKKKGKREKSGEGQELLGKKKKSRPEGSDASPSRTGDPIATGGEIKWGRAALRVLEAAGKKVKLRRLCKRAVVGQGIEPTPELLTLVEKRVRSSRRFMVAEDMVVALS